MPPAEQPDSIKPLEEIVEDVGLYTRDAYRFVQAGLSFAVDQVHGKRPDEPDESFHISGQQLCEGLRVYALNQWGFLARSVLARWGINCTYDFGRIVFTLVDHGHMSKTEQDTIEDFRNVFDFESALESSYRIEFKA